ncbi:hypothetical protein SISSUDRAFT_185925 [Sistotremastrum suecicum HHB10207 ss-3]|uniref:F-box domain-containing protein n=1 Tax=Sistotremastrum suecicum HHB10207 ss-3 TaxID=1314776 RepID=A0A166AFQ2_9AGAM|nr:hypothetical protein SISSUDRAFT_185925 [Sistotremastrum suecicum HHB10207 ss-3]
MNAALSILSFPPEIVIKSLEGLSIQDVVNVAQTCTSLRAIILSNKQSIMQTRNAFAIWQSLPHGSTPATISADLLYATAVASLAISKRLSSNMPLKPRNHVSYDLSLFDLTWNRTSPSHGHPAHFFLANDLLAFRSSSVLFIMKLGLSGAIDESVSLDLTSGNAYWYSVDYQLSDDGRALLVAVLIQNRTVSSRSLQVFEVSVETCGFGSNTLLLSVGVPFVEGSMSIALHDPYVVVSNNHEGLAIIDLRHKKGLTVSLLDRASLPELGGSGHKTMVIHFPVS